MHLFGCQLQLYRRQGHGLALVLHNTRKKSSQAVLGGPGRLQSLQCLSKLARLPPHTFVTNPEVVDVNELSSLLAATNQNCEMFPLLSAEVRPDNPSTSIVQVLLSTFVVNRSCLSCRAHWRGVWTG